MLFYLYFDCFYWAFTQKTKLLSVPFERDLQKIAKINSQQENQSFQIAKISSHKTQKIANPQN